MSFLRTIRPLPAGPEILQGSTVSLGTHIDNMREGTAADIPPDAIYAATWDEVNGYKEVVQPPAGFIFTHHFSGWEPESWAYPT